MRRVQSGIEEHQVCVGAAALGHEAPLEVPRDLHLGVEVVARAEVAKLLRVHRRFGWFLQVICS
jgi:predicted dithiol-disulfide oxidoreductase (DUF899 family)